MTGMVFVIRGRVKPYVRMTRRSKHVNPQAIEYNGNQTQLKWEIREQMSQHGWQMIERGTPIAIVMTIEMTGRLHCQDIDNQLKAIIDALQGVAFDNDLWVDEVWAARRLGTSDTVVVQVFILEAEDDGQAQIQKTV